MFRGFNIKNINLNREDYYFKIGEEMYNSFGKKTRGLLKDYTVKESLNGSKLQKDWFPKVEADIFLSHSHRDKDKAIAFAGYLKNIFDLTTFIDSCIWDYADDLLKEIDDEYCYKLESETYSYKKRNLSTSHVHMMLSSALTIMMDRCECMFFLNTPNSIKPNEVINKTYSPWIYFEIGMSKMIKKRNPNTRTIILEKAFSIEYELDLGHLSDIDSNILNKWEKDSSNFQNYNKHKLDVLYGILEAPKRSNIINE